MVPFKVYANDYLDNSGILQDCTYGDKDVADAHVFFHWQPREEDPNKYFGHYSFLVRGNDDEPADFMLPRNVPRSRFSADETATHCALADAKATKETHEANADAHGEAKACQQAEEQTDASHPPSPKKQAEQADAHDKAEACQQADEQTEASEAQPEKQAEQADAHGEAEACQQADEQTEASEAQPEKQAEQADAHCEAEACQQAEQETDASHPPPPKKQAEQADAHGKAEACQQAEEQTNASHPPPPKKQAEQADAHGEAEASQQAEEQTNASHPPSPKKQAEQADAHDKAEACQQADEQTEASEAQPEKQAEQADAHGEAEACQQADEQTEASEAQPEKQAEQADAHCEAEACQQAEQETDASHPPPPKKQAEQADAHGKAEACQQAEEQTNASHPPPPKKQAEQADAHGKAEACQQTEASEAQPEKQAEQADAHGEAKARQQADEQTEASEAQPEKQAEQADAHGEAKACQQVDEQTEASEAQAEKQAEQADAHGEAKACQQADEQTEASEAQPEKQAEQADAHGEAKACQQADEQTEASEAQPEKQAEQADAHGEAKACQQAEEQTDATQQRHSPKKQPKTATADSEATILRTFSQEHTTVASLKAFFDSNTYCKSNRPQSEKSKPESKQHAEMDTCASNVKKLFDPARYHGKLAALPEFPAPVPAEPPICQVDVDHFFNPDVYHGRQHVDCEQELQGSKPCKRRKTSESNHDELCMVVLMQPHVMNKILQEPLLDEKAVILPWKIKKGISKVYLAEVGTGGRIVAASNVAITALKNFADLRSHPYFPNAPSELQTAWRTRVVKQKLSVYSWSFKSTTLLETPLQLPLGSRGTYITVAKSCMAVCKEIPIPEMRLKSTCKYFMQKLSQQDYLKLKETARALDGVVIRTASTCSGTDVCCNIMRETFQCINEEFSVTRLYITNTNILSVLFTICIYNIKKYIFCI